MPRRARSQMSDHNMVFSCAGYGENGARCIQVVFGMEVIAYDDDSRSMRAFYPKNWSAHIFGVVLAFTKQKEYQSFSYWMEQYGNRAADPNSGIGEMIVYSTNPRRQFDKIAVLSTGVSYGDEVGKTVWNIAYNFTGARDYAENNTLGFDPLKQVTIFDAESEFYYPTGNQLGSDKAVDDGLYNAPENVIPKELITTKRTQ